MNRKKTCVLAAAVWLGIGASSAAPGGIGGRESTAPMEQTAERRPIIRLDLFAAGTEDILPQIRDIFVPKPVAPGPGRSDHPDYPGLAPADQRFSEAESAPHRQAVQLTYTGYVASGHFFIALIVYQGQPMAVAEGEDIGSGIRVVRITPESLEIAGPDSEIKAFPIEGELP